MEGWTLFIAFSSCLVLAHCFCHAHLHLPVVSYPSPPFFSSSSLLLSPPLLSVFWANLSLSGSMNTAEFHLNPRTCELWAKQEEQRTLLFHIQSNYSNYVIELSLQRSLHCSTVRNTVNKQKERGEREAEDRQQKTLRQFDAVISNCLDRFSDEFLCRCIDPNQPSAPAQPDVLNLLFKACSEGCNHIWLTAYINDEHSSSIASFTV